MTKYRPTEYHAGLRWDMEKAGRIIITPGTIYPPTEYHERQKLEKHYQEKKAERKRRGLDQ